MRSAAPLAPAAVPAALPDGVPPPFRPPLVPRARLVRRLRECRDVPIAIVVAPAGYGKSTLLAEWALRDDRPFAWLSLAADASAGVDAALRLVDAAADTRAPQVIVVDDAHLAEPAAARRLVDAARRLPLGAVLALASRREPAVPTGGLRAHRLVVEIRARELAMTRLEAAMLLDAAGMRLTGPEVDRLLARTEGWPAALYLAALALADADMSVDDFSGADRLVAEFMRDELLAGLPDEQRAFLRRTSLLAPLTGPLCDAVLETRGSTATLDELRRAGLPIEPVDRQDVAFRYHPLFGAMLRAELARLEPDAAPALHRLAADWLAAHGEPARAIDHAVACRDGARAGRLLWSLAPGYAAGGRQAALGEWLAAFTAGDVAAHPELALTTAAYHLADGRRDQAERATDTAERGLAEEQAAVAMLRACIARDGTPQMARDAARACELAPPGSPWQSLGRLLTGVAAHLQGDRDRARGLLEDGAARAAGLVPLVAALCHAQLALLAVEASDDDDAARHAGAAEALLGPSAGPAAPRSLVLAVCAVVAARRGDLAQARHDAADARALLAGVVDFTPWLLAEAQVWLARAEIRLSDGPAARALLSRAARIQAQVADAPVLAQWVHDGWERADAFAESATGDGPTLTNAELRVLRLLPSHLSFRGIGQRLHVSPNTVKTQALAVYRKLDVSSRSDAVARGQAAGLIDG